MSVESKTVVATGASSGLGFATMRLLLEGTQPYHLVLGCRNAKETQTAYEAVGYDTKIHTVTCLPLDLSHIKTVKEFAKQILSELGNGKIDYLFMIAGVSKGAKEPGINGSEWCEPFIVNHLSHHYLVHLLREKLAASRARIIGVTSARLVVVKDTSVILGNLKANTGLEYTVVYGSSKFVQFMGNLWWARELKGQCRVIAVAPGYVLGTGLGRHVDYKLNPNAPIPRTLLQGAQSLAAAIQREDLPEDHERIMLSFGGEWDNKESYKLALDHKLQDEVCPSQEKLEKDEHIV